MDADVIIEDVVDDVVVDDDDVDDDDLAAFLFESFLC